jgi:hypothetical protein
MARRAKAKIDKKLLDEIREEHDWASFSEEGPMETSSLVDDTSFPATEATEGPRSRVPMILAADIDLYRRKNEDYSPGDDPYANFRYASAFASAVCRHLDLTDPAWAAAIMVGIKSARLCSIGIGGDANFEAVKDTLRDLRVYAAILEDLTTK